MSEHTGMPATWKKEHKLFPYQVGFTCPPHDWDAAPSDFSSISADTVGVHGWMLHVPDYRHQLEQRALFDLITALNGNPPPVFDSDDILENPEPMV